MQLLLLTSLAAVAMAKPQLYHQQNWPASYGVGHASTTYGAYHPLHKREAETEAEAEAAPAVPLVGLHPYAPAYAPLAVPTLAHPYAALAHTYPNTYAALTHAYALAHPLAHPVAPLVAKATVPAVVPATAPLVAPAAPAPNDPVAPASWAAAHPEGLAHESVAGGLRTNHGDGSSYVFRSNV